MEINELIRNTLIKLTDAIGWDNSSKQQEAFNECYDTLLSELSRLREVEDRVKNIIHNTFTPDLVEEFFPKGKCAERGKAIVLHAKMLIDISNWLLAETEKEV